MLKYGISLAVLVASAGTIHSQGYSNPANIFDFLCLPLLLRPERNRYPLGGLAGTVSARR